MKRAILSLALLCAGTFAASAEEDPVVVAVHEDVVGDLRLGVPHLDADAVAAAGAVVLAPREQEGVVRDDRHLRARLEGRRRR